MKSGATKVFALLLLLASFSTLITAIGVRPSRLIYPFEEGRGYSIGYAIVNRDVSQVRVGVYFCGPLWKSISIVGNDSTVFSGENCGDVQGSIIQGINSGDFTLDKVGTLVKAQSEKPVTLFVKLPSRSGYDPGIVESRIGFIQLPLTLPPSGVITGGTAAVEGQLWFKVPYPGKYLTLDGEAIGAPLGEKARFKATLTNDGSETVSNARTSIDIFSPNEVRITTIELPPRDLKPTETADIPASWDTDGQELGTYRASFRLVYADKVVAADQPFKVGGLEVAISGISVKPVQKKSIAKILIEVESKWGNTIPDVYAIARVYDKLGLKVGESKTTNVDLQPYSKEVLQAFWETGESELGEYKVNATLFFSGKNVTAEGTVSIVEQAPGFEVKPEYALLAAVIIALALAAWFFRDRIRIRVS
jgi:hypothetical protein